MQPRTCVKRYHYRGGLPVSRNSKCESAQAVPTRLGLGSRMVLSLWQAARSGQSDRRFSTGVTEAIQYAEWEVRDETARTFGTQGAVAEA